MDSVKEEELTPQIAASKIQKGNPARLLKAINPMESQLLETSSRVHLRFRLGGENFPPNIYYKIFAHGAVVDLNSFAPRDYSVIKREQEEKKIKYEQYIKNKDQYQNQGWYLRIDNNGWRPISHKVFNKTDYVELFSANKIRYYHYKKEKRDEKVHKKKRLNKLRWIQNMYKNARKEEEEQAKNKFSKTEDQLEQDNNNNNEQQPQQNKNNIINNNNEFEEDDEQRYINYQNKYNEQYNQNNNYYDDDEEEDNEDEENDRVEKEFLEIPSDFNPLKDPKYIDMDEDQFDHEVKDLIEWSKNLDYDEYVKDWFQLSTSNASEAFVVKPITYQTYSTHSTTINKNNRSNNNGVANSFTQNSISKSMTQNQNSNLTRLYN